jgi:hypothetical protein
MTAICESGKVRHELTLLPGLQIDKGQTLDSISTLPTKRKQRGKSVAQIFTTLERRKNENLLALRRQQRQVSKPI